MVGTMCRKLAAFTCAGVWFGWLNRACIHCIQPLSSDNKSVRMYICWIVFSQTAMFVLSITLLWWSLLYPHLGAQCPTDACLANEHFILILCVLRMSTWWSEMTSIAHSSIDMGVTVGNRSTGILLWGHGCHVCLVAKAITILTHLGGQCLTDAWPENTYLLCATMYPCFQTVPTSILCSM